MRSGGVTASTFSGVIGHHQTSSCSAARPGRERGAAGEPGDDLGDERRGSLELELAEEAEIGDPDRVPAGGRLRLGLAVVGHDAPPGALCELRAGVAVGPFDRAARCRLGTVEGRRRVRGEELELGAGAHPRSRSWSGS